VRWVFLDIKRDFKKNNASWKIWGLSSGNTYMGAERCRVAELTRPKGEEGVLRVRECEFKMAMPGLRSSCDSREIGGEL
jgi:hypothetical protein